MLKDAIALEVVLAHRAAQSVDGAGRHGQRLLQFPKGHVVGVLVAVDVAVKKIGVFVVPHRQSQNSPASFFVQHDMSRVRRWQIDGDNFCEGPALRR